MMPSLVYAGSQVSSMLVSVTLPILNFPGCPGTEEGNKTNVICMDISKIYMRTINKKINITLKFLSAFLAARMGCRNCIAVVFNRRRLS